MSSTEVYTYQRNNTDDGNSAKWVTWGALALRGRLAKSANRNAFALADRAPSTACSETRLEVLSILRGALAALDNHLGCSLGMPKNFVSDNFDNIEHVEFL